MLPISLATTVAAHGQRARCGQPGIQLAQAAGGQVARVGVSRFSFFPALFVDLAEGGKFHIDLTAYLEAFREIPSQLQGHCIDGTDILGDVLADRAVAARRPAHQFALLIGQGHRNSVQFRFTDILNVGRYWRGTV